MNRKRASDYATEKTKEALKHGEEAKDYVVDKNVEAKDTAVDEAQKALDYVKAKGNEAGNKVAEFVEGKAGEAKDATKAWCFNHLTRRYICILSFLSHVWYFTIRSVCLKLLFH